MITITGTIENVSHCTIHEKVTVSLIPGKHERVYIDFKGKRTAEAVEFKKGDQVSIKIKMDGRKSKIGKEYNNIEGRSIKKHINQ